jgi:hypothetical protein
MNPLLDEEQYNYPQWMEAGMIEEQLKETIKRELLTWLREDPELRAYILDLTRREFAVRAETEDRFYAILAELRRDREEQARKWDEQTARWKTQDLKWEEESKRWAEENRKWDEQRLESKALREEQNRKWEEQNRRWAEENRKWDEQRLESKALTEEQNRKWEANQQELLRLHEEIMAQARKFDRSIGALGARWGLQSEKAFRDALAGILEEHFGVQVININEYDDQGVEFGRPEQVELDVIIEDGLLLICELKSSIDKAGMYIFERKARFYEKRHQRQANRLIVISPMIDAPARKVAQRLGIETYGDSTEVEAL